MRKEGGRGSGVGVGLGGWGWGVGGWVGVGGGGMCGRWSEKLIYAVAEKKAVYAPDIYIYRVRQKNPSHYKNYYKIVIF
jgi:hypothetical protein